MTKPDSIPGEMAMKRIVASAAGIAAVVSLGLVALATAAEKSAAEKSPTKPAAKAEAAESQASRLTADQARREVRLLDDLYKSAIIYINEVYVQDANSVAAGETARDLFAAMKAKGWHDARLVDATGKPLNEENKPQNDFEKKAVAKILAGETYYDQIVEENGHNYLRAATLVPAINDKCIICHPGNKVGDVLGAVSYKIAIE
jgi:hypothetical protein